MADSAPILQVIGVEGQIYMAEAMKKEFGRPVIAIAVSQRVTDIISNDKKNIFQKVYSLSEFYLEHIDDISTLSLSDLDIKQKNLERELGADKISLYASYDRALRLLGDYRKLRNWQYCNLLFLKKIFEEIRPAFVFSGVAVFLQHVMNHVCAQKNIPYIRTGGNRSGGAVLYHANGHFVGMEYYFNQLNRNGESVISKQILKEADAFFDKFVSRPSVPQYTVAGSTLHLNIPLLRKKISWALRPERIFPHEKISKVDRFMNIEASPLDIVLSACRTGFNRLHIKALGLFDKSPDMDVPFLYLPLHYAPEISDMYFGADYDHHAGFIWHLSKHVPSDCQIYVKDHVSMWGRRPAAFYSEISKIPNVKVIDPAIPTFDLIKAARATLAVTGTAGWEAYLLGKPVVALGEVFYDFLPGILHCSLGSQFLDKLNQYLSTFKPSEEERRNAYRAYCACSISSVYVDIGETIGKEGAPAAAQSFARGFGDLVRSFASEIGGEFPPDISANPLPAQRVKT